MRSQEDYLRDFAVLMTEKGVVAVSDPQQIAVYDFLCGGKKRPSDIAEALGFPSSSLHFVLDKMVDSGIIVRSKPDPSKKEVFYSILALRIAGSVAPTPEKVAASNEVFSHPDLHNSGLASVANMLESYTEEIGLEHGQLRARYAKDLAASFKDEIGTGSLESVMQRIKDRFTSLTGYRMSVFALNPPTIVFEGDKSMRTKMDMISLFVRHMMENSTGRTFVVKTIEDFSNEDVTRFKVIYDRAEPEPAPYVNTSLPQMAEPEKFMIVEIDGGVVLIMNDIQTRLIDAIYERPLCVTDVVNAVGMPRSTVTTNLLRMVEDGVASVFYSESGAVYYGLSCSILMKRTRRVSKDPTPTRDAIKSASREGGFTEGYMLYFLASLKELGFETDYMMVVLGARYMRAAGQDGPKNFDTYFGKMSDIAKVVGLSLNVVSVYPLTIGISGEDGELAPAMTFVKGMAHQGLEMASSGIFVRVSEETPEDMKVSFKEIYPSLSMNPAAAAEAEALASPVPAKKRTSSVRDALRNRSAKADGRPIRTVRYITGVAMVVFAAMIVVLAMGGSGDQNIASAESYLIHVDPTSDISLIDEYGEVMDMPYLVRADSTVTFSVSSGCMAGIVNHGVAMPLSSIYSLGEGMNADGTYTISLDSDIYIQEIREMPSLWNGIVAGIYDFGSLSVDASSASSYDGYIPVQVYSQYSGAVWTSRNAWVSMEAPEGDYLSFSDDACVYMDDACIRSWSSGDMHVKSVPTGTVTLSLADGMEIESYGVLIKGDVQVASGKDVSFKFVSTDGPVKVSVWGDGSIQDFVLTQNRELILNLDQDVSISYEPTEIY